MKRRFLGGVRFIKLGSAFFWEWLENVRDQGKVLHRSQAPLGGIVGRNPCGFIDWIEHRASADPGGVDGFGASPFALKLAEGTLSRGQDRFSAVQQMQ
jgi:hypothetical protein